MGRSIQVLIALMGFLAGISAFLWIPLPFFIQWISLVVFLFLSLFRKQVSYSIFGLVLFFLFFFIGFLRAEFSIHQPTDRDVDFYSGVQVELEGVISEVDIRRDKAKYTINVDQIIQKSSAKDKADSDDQEVNMVSGKVLISMDKFPNYQYGDRVKVVGQLDIPGEFEGFSYDNYLSRFGIYAVMYRPRVYYLESGHGNAFWHWMSFFQNGFMRQINLIFPEPYASFEAGLLVGARKGIHPDLMEKFNITGLTHIIAISGYNITLIIVFVMAALKRLPRRISFFIAILAIVLFTLFVGASPAVVRASIMGILGLIALQYGRQNNIHISVLMTAVLMIAWNPKVLWYDVGFQLSFMAVMGLIYVAPLFDRYAKYLPEALGIRESIQMTMAAQVMALPVIVYHFGRLSLIAPLANLLVAFALPLAMLLGFIAVLFSFFMKGLSLVFVYFTSFLLAYIIKIIEWMSLVPYASVEWVGMSLGLLVLYYVLLTIGLWWWRSGVRNKK